MKYCSRFLFCTAAAKLMECGKEARQLRKYGELQSTLCLQATIEKYKKKSYMFEKNFWVHFENMLQCIVDVGTIFMALILAPNENPGVFCLSNKSQPRVSRSDEQLTWACVTRLNLRAKL